MKTNLVYLSLGSNLEDKAAYLKQALKCLTDTPLIKVTGKSSVYQTDPVGFVEQDFFLNGVLELETKLEPGALLNVTQDIENRLGRKRTIHWGPRTMDIDILLFNEELVSERSLIIPHPEMHRRRFVLVPLVELNPSLIIPSWGEAKEVLEQCSDLGRVFLAQKSNQW